MIGKKIFVVVGFGVAVSFGLILETQTAELVDVQDVVEKLAKFPARYSESKDLQLFEELEQMKVDALSQCSTKNQNCERIDVTARLSLQNMRNMQLFEQLQKITVKTDS